MLVGLLLADCAGGSQMRYLTGERTSVQVEGIPYHVMMAEAPGGFDFKSFREENFVIAPDELAEKRRNLAAVMQIAARACGDRKPVVTTESKSGSVYYTAVRCG